MKKLLYIMTMIVLISSCRSLEKMVERGDYDSAIIYAADKLAGKKKKKTKHVQGLEEAFAKINQRDLDQIAYLDGASNPANWETIEHIADKIARRQRHILPLVPLVSKDGYEAYFDFVDTDVIRTKARKGAADYFYKHGMELLTQAYKTGNKRYAREAHSDFRKVKDRMPDYDNIHNLLLEAKEAGIVYIKVEVQNNSLAYVPAEVNKYLGALNVNNLNNTWKEYYLDEVEGIVFDNKAILELNDIQMSPERETVTYHTDEKRVSDGFDFIRGKNGKIKKDSTGKKLKEEKFKIVYADITEIYREKFAYISGNMKIFDYKTNALLSSETLSVEAAFTDYASSFRGDRRALSDRNRNRLKGHPRPFPHDFDMITDATELLKDNFLDALAYTSI